MRASGRILITGATGFVGHALVREARSRGLPVRAALRRRASAQDADQVVVGDIQGETDWSRALEDCGAVIHLANLAHVPADERELARVNVAGTLRLARQAWEHGVRRMIYVSSIKTLGEETHGHPLEEGDPPAPCDAYGRVKLAAEQGLREFSTQTGLEITIVRPPLVYGPGVKGNFAALLQAVARGWPLPLASIDNRRSVLYVGNLADALLACLGKPAAVGRIYHVVDGAGVSTPALVLALATALGRPARMVPFPAWLLERLAASLGRGAMARRLTRSLEVSDAAIRSELGWRPPIIFEAGLRLTADWFRRREG